MTSSPGLRLAASLSEAGRQLSLSGLRRQHPQLSVSELELKLAFIELAYGPGVAAMRRRAAAKRL